MEPSRVAARAGKAAGGALFLVGASSEGASVEAYSSGPILTEDAVRQSAEMIKAEMGDIEAAAPSQVEAIAREAIARLKFRKIIRSTKADWRLVAAAQAIRREEYNNEFAAADAVGTVIKQRREVSNWVDKLDALAQCEPTCAAASMGSSSAIPEELLVQAEWRKDNTPGIQELAVAVPILSPEKRHAKRTISAVSSTPLGTTRTVSAVVDYTLPPADGERESASKRRYERHWHREASKLRSMDLSGAFEAHAAADAERKQLARAREREVADVLDRIIFRIEREIRRDQRSMSRAARPWSCPAGCKPGQLRCARESFRGQCLPSPAAIQAQQRRLWDDEHLTKVFVGISGIFVVVGHAMRRGSHPIPSHPIPSHPIPSHPSQALRMA